MEKGRLNMLIKSLKSLIGKYYVPPVSFHIIDEYGYPETLSGTNNKIWTAYFSDGNFTLIINKNTHLIKKVLRGKQPQKD